jgi:polyferredoxin
MSAEQPNCQVPSVLSTIEADGKRRWMNPRLSPGRLLSQRRALAWFLIVIFTAMPFLTWNGKPFVLLDLRTRHFTIFGNTFLPTDTLLLAFLIVSIFVTIFLLTALFGRVWCGWACPQTVYMEFVFRPIERLFEGAPGRAKKGWLQTSGAGKALKYPVFFLVACYLAHTFLAYFVGVEELRHWMTQSPFEHPTPFLVMAVTTGLMLFDFTFFREQTCIVACPYGRFQSVMLDRHSRIVAYDKQRGEPRGRSTTVSLPVISEPAKAVGDCVDCKLCVSTCPTGIDIRNGLQMECVNCAQCIDACDAVMTKLGRETGLIRYASQAVLAGEPRRVLRPRVLIYPALLAIMLTGFGVTLYRQDTADITILRGLGAPFVQVDDTTIANVIRIKIVNRSDAEAVFTASAVDVPEARVESDQLPATVLPGHAVTIPARVLVPLRVFEHGAVDVKIRVADKTHELAVVRYRVLGPGSVGHPEHAPHQDEDHREEDHKKGEHK